MRGASLGRKKDFKKGLGSNEDATDRHAQKAFQIRKQKQEDRIQLIRNQTSKLQSNNLADPLQGYNRKAFVEQKNLDAFRALAYLLETGTEAQICEVASQIADYKVLSVLVYLLGIPETSATAASCILNITGIEHLPTALVNAEYLLTQGFLDIVYLHIQRKTPIVRHLWGVVANLTCVCDAARDIVLESKLILNEQEVPPFIEAIQRGDPELQDVILLIVNGIFQTGNVVPPQPFVYVVWPIIVKILYQIFPEPRKQEHGDSLTQLDYILGTFQCMSERLRDPAFFTRLLGLVDHATFIPFMVRMIPRVDAVNQVRVAKFLIQIGMLPIENCIFHRLMQHAGCVDIMIRLVQHPNERLQREGIIWIGNYASDGVEFVEELFDKRAFDEIINILRRNGKRTLVRQSIAAILGVCCACVEPRDFRPANNSQGNNLQVVPTGNNQQIIPWGNSQQVVPWGNDPSGDKSSDNILCHLIFDRNLLQVTKHLAHQPGEFALAQDMLNMWYELLLWKFEPVRNVLEEIGALDIVAEYLGSKYPPIFELAAKIEKLCDKKQEAAEVYEIPNPGFIAPGVFRGGFSF